ncbi:hypothetical protein [Bradyrhizobium sp. Ec3.3]|nr:hypothetical protein [Bradyrhizobium sp. Ec3.3]
MISDTEAIRSINANRRPGTQDTPNPVIRANGRKIAHNGGP